MPIVKFKHIVSFSSEDKIHKAENLLNGNSKNKWRCGSAGERQASVVIQLERATAISSIDIGNDGSAFVEVLVSRSTGEEVHKVLLIASSFMSPNESRSGSGANRVRMFDSDKLSTDVANEKWDRIKVVCTQPFNKHSSYGLHFINLYSPEKTSSDSSIQTSSDTQQIVKTELQSSAENRRTSFGAFKLKADIEKKIPSARPQAAKLLNNKPENSIDIEKLKRKHTDTTTKVIPAKKSRSTASSDSDHNKNSELSSKQQPSQHASSSNSLAQKKISKERSPPRSVKKFDKILDGVVFALSGFQNPKRGDIRDKGLMMGAQYRRDWTADCTHLICAFANTPKYQQVMGTNGKVVRDDWITDCYKKRSRLPIKAYNMRPDYTSADEDGPDDGEAVVDPYDDSTDEDSPDTEDEIERLVEQQSKQSKKEVEHSPQGGDKDPYDESTDEETEDSDHQQPPSLPDYLAGLHFFLFGEFDEDVERMLRRHIVACDGVISNYMDDDVRYVITESSWQQEFDDALGDNSDLVFVRPTWLFKCGQERKLLPHHPYIVPSK